MINLDRFSPAKINSFTTNLEVVNCSQSISGLLKSLKQYQLIYYCCTEWVTSHAHHSNTTCYSRMSARVQFFVIYITHSSSVPLWNLTQLVVIHQGWFSSSKLISGLHFLEPLSIFILFQVYGCTRHSTNDQLSWDGNTLSSSPCNKSSAI